MHHAFLTCRILLSDSCPTVRPKRFPVTPDLKLYCGQEFDLENTLSSREVRIEVHGFNLPALVGASLNEVAKIPEGVAALLAYLGRLFTAGIELFDRALEAYPQGVGGNEQHFAHGARDPVTIGVDVVHRRELGGDLGAQTVRK